MSRFVRIVFSPTIIGAYTCYGAVKGRVDGIGFSRGAMLGALFGITYIITGDRLKMEQR